MKVYQRISQGMAMFEEEFPNLTWIQLDGIYTKDNQFFINELNYRKSMGQIALKLLNFFPKHDSLTFNLDKTSRFSTCDQYVVLTPENSYDYQFTTYLTFEKCVILILKQMDIKKVQENIKDKIDQAKKSLQGVLSKIKIKKKPQINPDQESEGVESEGKTSKIKIDPNAGEKKESTTLQSKTLREKKSFKLSLSSPWPYFYL